jgi:ABC-type transporter Mla subunit MlaD
MSEHGQRNRTFWQRVGGWFQSGASGGLAEPKLPAVGRDGLLVDGPDGTDEEDGAGAATSSAEKTLSRWARRDAVIQQLQEGHERVTELIDAIQCHLAEQGKRTDRIASSLDQLARTLSDLPNVSRQHAKVLDAIAMNLEQTNARAQQLADGIRDLPGAARAQSEALAGVSRQLELSNESHVQVNHTLQSLGRAVDGLRDTGQRQTESLRQFHQSGQDREGRLADLIAQQQKRFAWLFVITLVLALVGAVSGMTLLVIDLAR